MTGYLRIITRLLKLLPPPPRGPAAWGNCTAVCGAELKAFILHHFKPHFHPPTVACVQQETPAVSLIIFFTVVAFPENSDLTFLFCFCLRLKLEEKWLWRICGIIPSCLSKSKTLRETFFWIRLQDTCRIRTHVVEQWKQLWPMMPLYSKAKSLFFFFT